MWPFSRKVSFERSGIFRGFTDWHCHLLPGVDDGVRTMEESLAILSCYEEFGIKTVWLTPHIMEDVPNTTAHLRQRFNELKSAYKGDIALHLAAENMLDSLFEERLAENDLLPLGESRGHLLVETSYYNPPMNFQELLERIKESGYTPVLAHPERYNYMTEDDYYQLKSMNIKFQLNLFSLTGFYGDMVKKKAEWMLKEWMYDLSGTDIHGKNYLNESKHGQIKKSFISILVA